MNTTTPLPWRFDFENLPRDGSIILVWREHVLFDLVVWTGVHFEGELMGKFPADIAHKYIKAWCPITPPEVQP